MEVELTKKFRFEAAHWLPCFPEGHKCRRMHGHSFEVLVNVRGQMDPDKGYLVDYGDIKAAVKPLIDLLDHYVLNDVGTSLNDPLLLNPTSENLAVWFYRQIKPRLPLLSSIKVYETCTSACTFYGE